MIKEKKVNLIKRESERKYKNHESERTFHLNILCYYYSFDLDGLEKTLKNELNATLMKLKLNTKEADTIQLSKRSRDDNCKMVLQGELKIRGRIFSKKGRMISK